jgi:predicted nucleic acid-binding protein
VSRAADTSVVVPALLTRHEAHELCANALRGTTASVAHVVAEAYSVLTRMPHPDRVEPLIAAKAIAAQLPERTVGLEPSAYGALPSRLADAGLSGGSIYDALIALGAAEHGLSLITRDARAARTYRSLHVAFELLT